MWYPQILDNMRKKGSDELATILQKRDTGEWSEETFRAAEEVLAERGYSKPAKEPMFFSYKDITNNQPDELPEDTNFQYTPQSDEQAHEPSIAEARPIEIFIAKREHRTGPFTVQQIDTMISSGMVDLSDMAWHSKLLDWTPLHQVLGVCPPIPAGAAVPPKISPPKEAPTNPNPKSKKSGLPASFELRFVANFIDQLVLIPLSLVVTLAVLLVTKASEESIPIALNISGIFTGLIYFSLMESSPKMATLGKMAMGLVVVDYKGKRLSFDKATSRWLGKFISALSLGIGFLMPLWTKRKQCLHDFMASTLVIHK